MLKEITMHKVTSLFKYLFITLLLTSQLAHANKISDGEVYNYLDLSGLKASIQGMPAQIEAMYQQIQLTAQDPEKAKTVLSFLLSSWHEEKINHTVISHIQANMSQTEMTNLLTWLQTDLVKKVKSAELQATQPDIQQELMIYVAGLQSNPPTPERMKIVRAFVNDTKMVDRTLDMMLAIIDTMMITFQATSPEVKVPQEQITAQIQQMEAMLRPALDQQMVMMSYYLYRDINDAELSDYIRFYNEPLGKKEMDIIFASMTKAMKLWGEDISVAMADDIKESATE